MLSIFKSTCFSYKHTHTCCHLEHKQIKKVPARSGRGTPPTKMVFLGSRGWDPSITKSLSFRFQGRIWTCCTQIIEVAGLRINSWLHQKLLFESNEHLNRGNATDRFVFNGGAGDAQIEFTVLLDAGVDQSLHGAFILEQQEGVACIKQQGLFELLRPHTQKLFIIWHNPAGTECADYWDHDTLLLFTYSNNKKNNAARRIWLTKASDNKKTEPQM